MQHQTPGDESRQRAGAGRAVALACLVAVTLAAVALALRGVSVEVRSSEEGFSISVGTGPDGRGDATEGIGDYLDEADGAYATGEEPASAETGEIVGRGDALGYNLAPYHSSLDSEVAAIAYSNTAHDVRAAARGLVTLDLSWAQEVADDLTAASLGPDTARDRVDNAIDAAEQAVQEIEGLDLAVGGAEEQDLLDSAKAACLDRWEAILEELRLLAEDEVDMGSLEAADGEVVARTEEAGGYVTQALQASAANR